MRLFRDLSIKAKLNLLLAIVSGSALLLACAAFVGNDIFMIRESTSQHIAAIAEVVGANSVAAVTFNDKGAAAETLSSLRREPIIRSACLYGIDGEPFASYQRHDILEPFQPPPFLAEGREFTSKGRLQVFTTLSDSEEAAGFLYVEAGMDHLYARLKRYLAMVAIVLAISLGFAMVLSSKLQQVVSVPITRLAATAESISANQDYSIRVQATTNDEIGSLYDEFNRMLTVIELNEQQLKSAHEGLQNRTRQLTQSNEVLNVEIVERKRAEANLESLNKQIGEMSRQAGMAEVATSVLHNVGNVLNSVNVSTTLISEAVRGSQVSDLAKVSDIILEHSNDLGTYIAQDERGKHLPRFLSELSRKMAVDEEAILEEARNLEKNIEHIKDIVSVQQAQAGNLGIHEEVTITEQLDDAIRINLASAKRHAVKVFREYDDLPPVVLDKQKLLMIVINLISNAKNSVIESKRKDKQVTVRLMRDDANNHLHIEVCDNGTGIPLENRARIFAHGFTTRTNGHGFGLHSSALAAKEMDGQLTVHSDGPGTGATFTLDLPLVMARSQLCTT